MAIEDSASTGDAFTFERHGDLTVITATEAIERIDFSLAEEVAELILNPLERQENPLIVFDLESCPVLRLDVPRALDPLLEAGSLPGRLHGAFRSDRAHAGIAASDRA